MGGPIETPRQITIAALVGQGELRAAGFIVTLYGDVVEPRGGLLWMGTLVEVCGLVGISETRVRTAVSRLVAAGRLEGMRAGRLSYYRLTEAARREFAEAAALVFDPPPRPARWLIAESASGPGFAALGGNGVVRELQQAVAALRDPVDVDFVREFQKSTMARPCAGTFLDTIVAESLKVPARVWRDALAGQIGDDVSADLGRIEVPTLIAWGDRDRMLPPSSARNARRRLPDARMVSLLGSGHVPMADDPVTVAEHILWTCRSADRKSALVPSLRS